jgi:hypothetical protein
MVTYCKPNLRRRKSAGASEGQNLMPPPNDTSLDRLYASLGQWMTVATCEQAMQAYFKGLRTDGEIADYRTKRGLSKKRRDEVTPVQCHLRYIQATGEIRFELSDRVPDCWLRETTTATPQGLEVTVALSREQYMLGRELNEKRMGRGFLGLPDNADDETFSRRLASPRIMHSTEGALRAIRDGIKRCLERKSSTKYAGLDLLIEAPLGAVLKRRWRLIEDELREAASTKPFREIHVIGNGEREPFGFRIK